MNQKSIWLIGIGILIAVFSMIGVSYAVWQITLTQEDENIVESDCFFLEISGEKTLYLKNMIPIAKEELETQFFSVATPYHFTITNQCAKEAKGSIQLETLDVTEGEKLDDKWINVALYDGTSSTLYSDPSFDLVGHPSETKLIKDSLASYFLYDFTLASNEKKEFNLFVFLDEDAEVKDQIDEKKWMGQITIHSAYQAEP